MLTKLIDQATALPWRIGFSDNSGMGEYDEGISITINDKSVVMGGDMDGCKAGVESMADARLICLAVNNLPALVEALREYMDAEEIDDPQRRLEELAVCRAQTRAILAKLDKEAGDAD